MSFLMFQQKTRFLNRFPFLDGIEKTSRRLTTIQGLLVHVVCYNNLWGINLLSKMRKANRYGEIFR
jgi:hypothetical protein